jgi:hypothetical protein
VSNEQREQQQAPAPQQPREEPRREFARKGAIAAIGGVCSGTAKAVWLHLLGDGS